MNFEVIPVQSVLSYGAVGAIRGWIPTPEFPERVGFCQIIAPACHDPSHALKEDIPLDRSIRLLSSRLTTFSQRREN
jgi:hypothetical protein